jgi:hypothetical protein
MARGEFTLPDGSETDDVKVYAAAWREVYEPIEKALDCFCYGYDPSCSFDREGQHNRAQLPKWFARDLSNLFGKVEHLREQIRQHRPDMPVSRASLLEALDDILGTTRPRRKR